MTKGGVHEREGALGTTMPIHNFELRHGRALCMLNFVSLYFGRLLDVTVYCTHLACPVLAHALLAYGCFVRSGNGSARSRPDASYIFLMRTRFA